MEGGIQINMESGKVSEERMSRSSIIAVAIVVIDMVILFHIILLKGNSNIVHAMEVEVPVNMVVEENAQKSVDEGHSPWKLDPAFVTQVFVSLLILPEGIQGDYPIPYENIKIIRKTGASAIAEISSDKTTINRVYLKRLIRQDSTGIWSVVGYDTRDK